MEGEVPPEEEKPNVHNFRDVFVGFSKDEIVKTQTEYYYDDERPKQKFKVPRYKNNKIKTSKYNFINFIPKSLFFQFVRLYNFYFLATVILQGIPIVSTMPVYLAALPFVFVLGVSIIRELVEDIKRKIQDRKTNNDMTRVLRDRKFHQVKWEQLKVGDIVYVKEGEVFPADLVMLTSSDHYGTSYIQTMTLDGERALKPRQAFVEIKENMKSQFVSLDQIKCHLKCGKPDNKIYQFEGMLQFEKPDLPPFKITLDQMLLRGAVLSNTDWVIGLVVYAGHDTKLMKNMGKAKYKQSHIERTLNKVVIFLILFQCSLCLLAAILATDFEQDNKFERDDDNNETGLNYLSDDPDSNTPSILEGILAFTKYFLILSSILPISLLVSLEIIKIIQSIFISFDAQMYSITIDQKCKVISMSLNEELGLINNVFTDKTGTLTVNEMVFKACSVGLLRYDKKTIDNISSMIGSNSNDDDKHSQNNVLEPNEVEDENKQDVLSYMKKILTLGINEKEDYNEYKFGNICISKQTDFLHYFWLCLCLCHEVISISQNKQNIKKEHDDAMFIFKDDSSVAPKKSSSKLLKKRTYDNRMNQEIEVSDKEAKDDFNIANNNSKLLDSQEIKSESFREEVKDQNAVNLQNEMDSLSELEIDENDELVYHGMSPDEITLVNAAKEVGFEFRYRSNQEIVIKVNGFRKTYKLLKMFPFTSERKRMSIVVQDPNDPEYTLVFCKGADSVMKNLKLNQYTSHFGFSYVDKFAKKGYRTLMVGMKVIRYDEFLEWETTYDEVHNDIQNSNKDILEQLTYLIEKDLFLVGITALEDRLQENVHECIEEFRRADIKVWMITGDKLETAENIGISCRLLHDDGERFYLTESDPGKAMQEAKEAYKHMKMKIKQNRIAVGEPQEESDDSDFERESVKSVREETKREAINNSLNGIEISRPNQALESRTSKSHQKVSYAQTVTSDFNNPNRKLQISEKRLFIKQIVLNSSLNTSFNPSRIKPSEVADINFEIIIEGDCLNIMLRKENRKLFGKIVKHSNVVLVCRSSPKQKAEVIKFAKWLNPKMVSLAIGDGGNDVSMIKEADVGIGIFGKEGYQAVTASDYAIGEFQFLRRLMFYHGRYCTRRITIFIYQFLLKNLIFSLCQLCFSIYSGYSGQTFFEPGYVSSFNLFASQLMICALASYDQDMPLVPRSMTDKLLMPYLYSEMRDHYAFNLRDFGCWYLYGVYVGACCYYLAHFGYQFAIDTDGMAYGLWQFSFSPYVGVVLINLTFSLLYIQKYDYVIAFVIFLHVTFFYPFFVLTYNEYKDSFIYKNQLDFYSHPTFWITTLAIVGFTIPPVLFIKHGKQLFYPSLANLVLSKRIDKDLDIEEKLKIDIVKLEKDLDSSSDESLNDRIQGNETENGFPARTNNTALPTTDPLVKDKKSDRSNLNCESEIGQVEYEDSESIEQNMHKSFSEVSVSASSAQQQLSLKHSHSVSSGSSSNIPFRSMKKSSDNRSPAYDKGFTGVFRENKKSIDDIRYSNSAGFKGSKRKHSKSRKKRSKNGTPSGKSKQDLIKFYPHGSSVSGYTIQEKSDEEDIDEQPPTVKRHKIEEEKYEQESSSNTDSVPQDTYSKQLVIKDQSMSYDTNNEDFTNLPHFNSPEKLNSGMKSLKSLHHENTVIPTTLNQLSISQGNEDDEDEDDE